MKKFGAILLLIGFLSSSTVFREVLRLPFLVAHFWKHQTEKPEITVIEFLMMHYANGNTVDEDYDQDMKLPFKTSQLSQNVDIVFYAPCFQIVHFNQKSKPSIQLEMNNYFSNYISSGLLNAIWQPPRC